MSQRFLKTIPLITGVLLLSILFSYLVLAWTSPSQPPPEGNVPAPINVGTSTQAKMGDLKLANLYLNATGNEGNIYAIDQLIGYNDLRLKSTSTEASPIYYGASTHRFFTGGTERLTILNNGNVGIGTTTPAYKLDVVGTIRSAGYFDDPDKEIYLSSPTGWPGIVARDDSGHRGDIRRLDNRWSFAIHDKTTVPPEVMVITESGNVGIGTTTPAYKLDVVGTIRSAGYFDDPDKEIYLTSPTGWPGIVARDDSGHRGDIRRLSDRWSFAIHANTTIPPEVMVITESGNVGIGTTTPATPLHVVGVNNVGGITLSGAWGDIVFDEHVDIATKANNTGVVRLWTFTNGTGYVRLYISNNGNVGIGTTDPGDYKLKVNGNMYADSYNCASDINKKTNLQKLEGVLEKISEINGYYFNWKNDPDGKRQIGLVAQEVEKFFPELVTTTKTENGEEKALDYSRMTAILLEAIKEQQAEIEKLKAEIERLKK